MVEITPVWLKRTVRTAGLVLAVPGLVIAINLFCIVPLVLLSSSGEDVVTYGVISLTFTLLTLGAGAVAFWHAQRALNNKPSNPLRLPPPILLVGVFILLIEFGIISRMRLEFFFPPVLVLCAILPPIWAVAWIVPSPPAHQTVEDTPESSAPEENPPTQYFMTWRRGLLALTGGATVSVFITVVLEILLPIVILSLVFNLADTVLDNINSVLTALSARGVADALTSQGFVFLFIQIAVIAPLVEEIAKPLVTLPLLRNMTRQEAYWLGAMAGAGFAVLENIIYATSSLSLWAGVLLVRALGSALHPLGSGLMAVGWRDLLRGEKDAATNWCRRYGIAVAVHAAWNGGSLLVITLGGAGFFGEMPAEIDLLGVSAAGASLAFLAVLGLSALWIGRAYGHDRPLLEFQKKELADTRVISSDRAAAIWALACLAAIVPAGIAGLLIWLR
jgi:RsiW-degrading membrane proteinase PrsW (M82 family)